MQFDGDVVVVVDHVVDVVDARGANHESDAVVSDEEKQSNEADF